MLHLDTVFRTERSVRIQSRVAVGNLGLRFGAWNWGSLWRIQFSTTLTVRFLCMQVNLERLAVCTAFGFMVYRIRIFGISVLGLVDSGSTVFGVRLKALL